MYGKKRPTIKEQAPSLSLLITSASSGSFWAITMSTSSSPALIAFCTRSEQRQWIIATNRLTWGLEFSDILRLLYSSQLYVGFEMVVVFPKKMIFKPIIRQFLSFLHRMLWDDCQTDLLKCSRTSTKKAFGEQLRQQTYYKIQ